MSWLFFAFVSAAFAALTAILAKIGVENVIIEFEFHACHRIHSQETIKFIS